ncbi:MAG: DUF4368 domain-containing protein [Candidatus Fimivivens sp.]
MLLDLSRMPHFVEKYEEECVKLLIDKALRDMQSENRKREQELTAAISRNQEIDTLFDRMYEDNASGKLSDERFMQMSKRYDKQRKLKLQISKLQKEVKKECRHSVDADGFLAIVRKYTNLQELNLVIVNELIEKIVVHQAEKIGKERVQKVEIFYNFIGILELPDMADIPKPCLDLDIRQGVTVKYATGKAS